MYNYTLKCNECQLEKGKIIFKMKLREKIEAIIFFSGEPIAIELLAETLEVKNEEIVENIERLIEEKYSDENTGIELIITDGMVQFVAKKEAMEYINKIFDKRTNPKLTKAAMEVLSIIAYNKDITRAEIENIRGVSSDAIIYKLIEYGLIKESGKREMIGRPMGYRTTEKFLLTFGIQSLEELPKLDEINLEEK